MTVNEDDLKEFLNDDSGQGQYFAVFNDKSELIGFYSFIFECGIMSIVFGLKPELTGRKIGTEFVIQKQVYIDKKDIDSEEGSSMLSKYMSSVLNKSLKRISCENK